MEIGIWTDICNIFTDSETQGPVLSTAAFYFPSHVPRLHISTIWLATSRLSLSLGNTEERSACIKVTISRIFPPNDCGQKVFIAVEIKNDFRACGISAIIRKFVIESPRLASGRPRLQVEDPAPGDWSVTTRDTGPERRAYIDAIRNVGIHGAHHGSAGNTQSKFWPMFPVLSFPPTTLLICDNFLSVISMWVWVGHEAQNTRPACGLAAVRSNVRRDDAIKYVYYSLFVSDKL